jgi:hypothetical protein
MWGVWQPVSYGIGKAAVARHSDKQHVQGGNARPEGVFTVPGT